MKVAIQNRNRVVWVSKGEVVTLIPKSEHLRVYLLHNLISRR